MKLSVLVLSIITVISEIILAQDNLPPQLSANYKNIPLEEIIEEIDNKHNIKFSYLDQFVENKRITAFFKNKTLPEALQNILQGTSLSFQIVDSINVILFKKEVQESFSIQGRVIEKETREAIPFANVIIPSLGTGDATDENGYYEIAGLPSDTYDMKVQVIGYKELSKKISLERDTYLNAELEIQAIELAAVEITPGIIQITADEPAANTLTSQEILSAPNWTKDIYRSIQVLPGVATTDFRAKPYIKGGNPNETAVFLDNMELYEPYHVYENDAPISLINSQIIKNAKLLTGGFSAKYTDRMSGIFNLDTINEKNEQMANFSLDVFFASFLLSNRINEKFSHFLSVRRSFLDLLGVNLDKDGEFKWPRYYDIWSKLNYRANHKHRFSFNFLFSNDEQGYDDPQALIRPEYFTSLRRNYYGWINWHWLMNRNLYVTTTVGFQNLKKESDFEFEFSLSENNIDNRHTNLLSLTQNYYWTSFNRHSLEFGFELKKFFSDYFFSEIRTNPYKTTEENIVIDSIFVDSKFSGQLLSGFLQDTWAISNRLKFLMGLRISGQNYTDNIQIAPRSSISYNIRDNLSFKLAYGWYYQPDNFQKLRSYEGQGRPNKTVSKSIHYLAELNYHFLKKTTIKWGVYYKDYKRLQEDFDFDFFNRYDRENILDEPFNPISGYSTGFETFIRHQYARSNLFSVAYTYSFNRIKNEAGRVVPRDFDRTHTIAVNNIFNFKPNITLSALWRFHTGDPYTSSEIRTIGDGTVGGNTIIYYEFKEKNSQRLPVYHSLDIRVEKNWQFKKTSLQLYLNIINVYNRRNVRSFFWAAASRDNQVVGFNLHDFPFFKRFLWLGVGVSF